MIPNTKDRNVQSSGVAASSEFGISLKDSAHIMTILRDTLYSDKVLAVLREYGANAWDSHRTSGKRDVPIKVVIPTTAEPTLTIRDFGAGLSHQDVFEVYTQYGSSTKRGNDDAVGMLGIGSKSGFAYSDSFTVCSYHGGMKRTYVAVLDASDKGVINLLVEEPCGDETGVEIKIPIKVQDIPEFIQKARELFQYFEPRPDINIDLPAVVPKAAKLQHGAIFEEGFHNSWTAIMGCVPYRINVSQIRGVAGSDGSGGVGDYVYNTSGLLYFDIGEVQISASREELKYGTMTKDALIRKFNLLIEEFVRNTIEEIEKSNLSSWEKRLRSQVLHRLRLPIPDRYTSMSQSYVKLKDEPKTFTLLCQKSPATSIRVATDTRLIFRDERKRSLKGYSLGYNDYVVTPNKGLSFADVRNELNEMIVELKLDGVSQKNLSELSWYETVKRRAKNMKHAVRTFRLSTSTYTHCVPYSGAWEIEDRVPQDDDVFVVLSSFQTTGFDIYSEYAADLKMAEQFGGTMPPIYGYKTRDKDPISEDKCKGTPYHKWRKKFAKSLIKGNTKVMLDHYRWSHVSGALYSDWRANVKAIEWLEEKLGKDKNICVFLRRRYEGGKAIKQIDYTTSAALENLDACTREPNEATEGETLHAEIYRLYPLLTCSGIDALMNDNDRREDWIQYIRLIDAYGDVVKG